MPSICYTHLAGKNGTATPRTVYSRPFLGGSHKNSDSDENKHTTLSCRAPGLVEIRNVIWTVKFELLNHLACTSLAPAGFELIFQSTL
jgi:hypothetical protein